MDAASDAELVARCRAGDQQALGGARRPLRALRPRDRRACLPARLRRRRGRVPGGLRARLRAARHAPRRRRTAAVDRADRRATARSTRCGAPAASRLWTRCRRTSTTGVARLDEALTVHAALDRLSRRMPRDPRPLLLPRRELPDDRRRPRPPAGHDREPDRPLPVAAPGRPRPRGRPRGKKTHAHDVR